MKLAQSTDRDFLQDISLFSGLPQKDIQEFSRAAYARNYRKGEYVYHQGDQADRFFIILSGWVRLYREMIDGEQSVSHILTKGELFGEGIIFYQNNSYIFSAQVIEPTRIFEIPKSILQYRASENPEILKRVLNSMCEKMIKLQVENERLAGMTSIKRAACLLLHLSTDMIGNGGTFTFPYDKSLAASQLGMKRETFSRALLQLKPLGVSVNGSEIKIDNFKNIVNFTCKQCPLSPDQCAGARYNKMQEKDPLYNYKQP